MIVQLAIYLFVYYFQFLGMMDTINALLKHKYTPYIVGGAVVLISVTAIKRVLS